MAANGLPTHLSAHHMVTKKTNSVWMAPVFSADSWPGREWRSRSDPSGCLGTKYHRRCFGLMWRISRQHSGVMTQAVIEADALSVVLAVSIWWSLIKGRIWDYERDTFSFGLFFYIFCCFVTVMEDAVLGIGLMAPWPLLTQQLLFINHLIFI